MTLYYRGQCINNRLGDLPLDPPDDIEGPTEQQQDDLEMDRYDRYLDSREDA